MSDMTHHELTLTRTFDAPREVARPSDWSSAGTPRVGSAPARSRSS